MVGPSPSLPTDRTVFWLAHQDTGFQEVIGVEGGEGEDGQCEDFYQASSAYVEADERGVAGKLWGTVFLPL